MALPLDPEFEEPTMFDMPVASGFHPSEEVASVANDLIAKFNHFANLVDFDIRYAILEGDRPEDNKLDTLAKFVKAPAVWHDLLGIDAVVWVNGRFWKTLEENQREALIAHELCHAEVNDKGKLVVGKHDLEEFAFVTLHYGAWYPDVRLVQRSLTAFEGHDNEGERNDPYRGRPTVLQAARRFKNAMESDPETEVTVTFNPQKKPRSVEEIAADIEGLPPEQRDAAQRAVHALVDSEA